VDTIIYLSFYYYLVHLPNPTIRTTEVVSGVDELHRTPDRTEVDLHRVVLKSPASIYQRQTYNLAEWGEVVGGFLPGYVQPATYDVEVGVVDIPADPIILSPLLPSCDLLISAQNHPLSCRLWV
jgi:hypothetical protein